MSFIDLSHLFWRNDFSSSQDYPVQGSTKLAQAFAQYLSRPESPTVRLIPVGADWTSNENVVGYPDGLNPANYLVQPTLESILYALEEPAEPFPF